jgi:hypothetical protein
MRSSALLLLALLPGASLSFVALSAAAQVPPVRPGGAAPPEGPGRITGVVSDSTGQPLLNAAITLRSAADSTLVTGVLADRAGRFQIAGLAPGEYQVRVSLIGYRPRSSEVIRITPQQPTVDLGPIALQVSAVQLEAVEARVERPAVVVEADRTVYNTKSMPVASTGNASDVLRSVPELEVDVNDNVKLRGNQAVAIHLNGRPAPLRGEQLEE